MCVYVHNMHIHTNAFTYIDSLVWSTSTATVQTLASKYPSPLKGSRAL